MRGPKPLPPTANPGIIAVVPGVDSIGIKPDHGFVAHYAELVQVVQKTRAAGAD